MRTLSAEQNGCIHFPLQEGMSEMMQRHRAQEGKVRAGAIAKKKKILELSENSWNDTPQPLRVTSFRSNVVSPTGSFWPL